MNDDPILRRMATLPLATPDKARAARIRQRCHSALQHAAGHRDPARDGARHPWTAPAMTVLALVYLAQVVRLTLLVYVAR
jgi:hypothetical protein